MSAAPYGWRNGKGITGKACFPGFMKTHIFKKHGTNTARMLSVILSWNVVTKKN